MSLSVTVHGRDFQVAETEQWKARLLKAVLEKGPDSAVTEDERNNNNDNDNHDDIYSALMMTRSLREFTRFIC